MKTPKKYDDGRPAVDGDRTLLAKLFLGLVHLVTNIKYFHYNNDNTCI